MFTITAHFQPSLLYLSMAVAYTNVGNCDIRVERKISFTNKVKQYKIQPRLNGWAQNNLPNFTAKFCDGF
jgi:hypothetical protein